MGVRQVAERQPSAAVVLSMCARRAGKRPSPEADGVLVVGKATRSLFLPGALLFIPQAFYLPSAHIGTLNVAHFNPRRRKQLEEALCFSHRLPRARTGIRRSGSA